MVRGVDNHDAGQEDRGRSATSDPFRSARELLPVRITMVLVPRSYSVMMRISRAFIAVAVAATLVTAACSSDTPASTDGDQTGQSSTTGPGSGEQSEIRGDQLYFYPPVEGAELTVITDGDGSQSTVRVVGVEETAAGQIVRVSQSFGDADGLTVEATYTTGRDGSLILEVDSFLLSTTEMPEMDGIATEASGDDMVIPAIEDLEAGKTTSGTAVVTMGMEGFEISNETTFTVSGQGYESVTTALGTFEAYVVDVALTIESNFVGTQEGSIRYWFVPGFGWIRQETSIGGMTIVNEVTASTVTP